MENIVNPDTTATPAASRQWLVHFTRYFLVGGVAAVCDLAVFSIMAKYFGVDYLIATAASFAVGTALNFWLCLKFVFDLKGHSWVVGLWRKVLSALAGLAVNLGIMYLLVDLAGLDEWRSESLLLPDGLVIARVAAIGTGFVLNFILTKYYAFRDY